MIIHMVQPLNYVIPFHNFDELLTLIEHEGWRLQFRYKNKKPFCTPNNCDRMNRILNQYPIEIANIGDLKPKRAYFLGVIENMCPARVTVRHDHPNIIAIQVCEFL